MTDMWNELLDKQIQEMNDAGAILRHSYDKCCRIGVRPDLNIDQLESFEALTARFARLSDLVVQKVLRTISVLDLEEVGTVRDRINRAEKRGFIESAEDFVQIRMLRNEIAHEYKSETIFDIFERALALTPALLDAVKRIQQHINQNRST
ncbi:MAG: hypothetical protein Q7U40_02555 [Desulfatirhabdiaceae bacterium]|nr:hypothetical protein [Desulfatirhabdiaceae bacterium]